MQVTLLFVGLIVGFALGIGAGWYFWHGTVAEEAADERAGGNDRPAGRHPRTYEPSTPPSHHPSPRPRPVTALRHPAPNSAPPVAVRPPAPAPSPEAPPAPAAPLPAVLATEEIPPAPQARAALGAERSSGDAEPFDRYEYRPTPRREGPVSIDQTEHVDRHLLQDLLEANRRLTADAELRLRREGSAGAEQLALGDRPPTPRPPSPPAPDDLLARHHKLDEDSRRMGRRPD